MNDSRSADSILWTFVKGGLDREDLVALVWPRSEREELHRRLQTMGMSLDVHIARDNLVVLDAEDYMPRDPEDEASVAALCDDLGGLVGVRGKPGLSCVGRLAPSLFEQGDAAAADLVERIVRARHGTARVLCPYRSRDLGMTDIAGASRLIRSHSHTITTLGSDRHLVERVGDRPRS